MKPVVINIVGPTATGKTRLAVELARQLQTEIINADSRQVYKEMYIGTAIPSEEEKQNIPHHLMQHVSIRQPYTVKDFEKEALEKIESIHKKSPFVIVVGGTGLYFRALNEGLDEIPDIPSAIRHKILQEFEEKGLVWLQAEIQRKDPVYFQQADIQNPRRLLRALEVIRHTGKPFSAFRTGEKKQRNFFAVWIGLTANRELLYNRINTRVDRMMEKGLPEEVEKLYPHKHLQALQTVGYKELFAFLDKKISLEDAVENIKKNTRRYAKRQITWFKRNPAIHWLDITEPDLTGKALKWIEHQQNIKS